jgi:hypothetical protein
MDMSSFFGWPIPGIEGKYSLTSLTNGKRSIEIKLERNKILWRTSLIIDGIVRCVAEGFGFDCAVQHLKNSLDDYNVMLLDALGPNNPMYSAVQGHANVRPLSIFPKAISSEELEEIKRPSIAP